MNRTIYDFSQYSDDDIVILHEAYINLDSYELGDTKALLEVRSEIKKRKIENKMIN